MTTIEELDTAMVDLRQRGLSYPALAQVSDYVYGWRLPAESIRWRLQRHHGVSRLRGRARYGASNGLASNGLLGTKRS